MPSSEIKYIRTCLGLDPKHNTTANELRNINWFQPEKKLDPIITAKVFKL